MLRNFEKRVRVGLYHVLKSGIALHPRYKLHRKYYIEYKENEKKSLEELQDLQFKKLKEIVLYAYREIPFYKKLWNKHGVNPNFSTLAEFRKFPIVDKHIISKAIHDRDMGLEHWSKSELVAQSTTGSSGKPFEFFEDRQSWIKKWGKKLSVWDWYGLRPSVVLTPKEVGIPTERVRTSCEGGGEQNVFWVNFWRGKLRPGFVSFIKDAVLNRKTLCIYDPKHPKESALTAKRIREFIKELNSLRPDVIEGFVSSLNIIALFMLRNNIQLTFTPRAIVTGAELLTDEVRDNIKKAFDTTVFNRLGGTESGLVGHECRYQAENDHYLHMSTDTLFIETFKDKKSVTDVPGESVITHLENRAVPLIRYEIGDIFTIDTRYKCPCGLPFPVIRDIEGRINDVFVLSDGSLITTHLWQNYIKKAPFIEAWQMEQVDLNIVNISVVINQLQFNKEQFVKVQKLFQNALPGCKVKWNIVEHIEHGAGGKFRHCISRVDNKFKIRDLSENI